MYSFTDSFSDINWWQVSFGDLFIDLFTDLWFVHFGFNSFQWQEVFFEWINESLTRFFKNKLLTTEKRCVMINLEIPSLIYSVALWQVPFLNETLTQWFIKNHKKKTVKSRKKKKEILTG